MVTFNFQRKRDQSKIRYVQQMNETRAHDNSWLAYDTYYNCREPI